MTPQQIIESYKERTVEVLAMDLYRTEVLLKRARKEVSELQGLLEFYRAYYDNGPHVFDPPPLVRAK